MSWLNVLLFCYEWTSKYLGKEGGDTRQCSSPQKNLKCKSLGENAGCDSPWTKDFTFIKWKVELWILLKCELNWENITATKIPASSTRPASPWKRTSLEEKVENREANSDSFTWTTTLWKRASLQWDLQASGVPRCRRANWSTGGLSRKWELWLSGPPCSAHNLVEESSTSTPTSLLLFLLTSWGCKEWRTGLQEPGWPAWER